MQFITIKKTEVIESGWRIIVEVGVGNNVTRHSVILGEEYWQKLTNGREAPEELVIRSFEFLLFREPKESILKEFNLSWIGDYFPEYEKEIKNSN